MAAYFEHGPHIELDNPDFIGDFVNAVENAIHPAKLGHKNWMFVGGKDTGCRSAVIYTFVEQVRPHGMDPFRYFEWVFEKLLHHSNVSGEQIDALLPAAWMERCGHCN